jgi:hypothetical protein
MQAKIKEVAGELRRRMHQSIPEQGKWLKQVLTGFFNYHAVPTNWDALGAYRAEITERWRRTLSRRSQKGGLTWARSSALAGQGVRRNDLASRLPARSGSPVSNAGPPAHRNGAAPDFKRPPGYALPGATTQG